MGAANLNRESEWHGLALTRYAWRVTSEPADSCRRRPKSGVRIFGRYRITPEQYDVLRAKQDYRCGICGTDEADVDLARVGGRPRGDGRPLLKVPLAVDHDHKTGAIRGLLCPSCNAGLGAFGDDPSRLGAAIAYLKNARSTVREMYVGVDRAESPVQELAS
jgi:recombination endonuclease VII